MPDRRDVRDFATTYHFSQNNPKGARQDEIPTLLRRVAESLAALGDVDVMDITFRAELDDDGDRWPSMTVYYGRGDLPKA